MLTEGMHREGRGAASLHVLALCHPKAVPLSLLVPVSLSRPKHKLGEDDRSVVIALPWCLSPGAVPEPISPPALAVRRAHARRGFLLPAWHSQVYVVHVLAVAL